MSELSKATIISELQRYLPVLERAEADPETWQKLTKGTGIATANGYRNIVSKLEASAASQLSEGEYSSEFRRCLKSMFREEVGSNGWEYDYYRAKELFAASLPVAPQPEKGRAFDHDLAYTWIAEKIGFSQEDIKEGISPANEESIEGFLSIVRYFAKETPLAVCIYCDKELRDAGLIAAPQPEAETVERSGPTDNDLRIMAEKWADGTEYPNPDKSSYVAGAKAILQAATPQHPNRDVVEALRKDAQRVLDAHDQLVKANDFNDGFTAQTEYENAIDSLRAALSATRSEAVEGQSDFIASQRPLSDDMQKALDKTYSRLRSQEPTSLDDSTATPSPEAVVPAEPADTNIAAWALKRLIQCREGRSKAKDFHDTIQIGGKAKAFKEVLDYINTHPAPQVEKMREALKAYEQWEADVISDNACWEPAGMASAPTLRNGHWGRLIEIQAMRNAALSLMNSCYCISYIPTR